LRIDLDLAELENDKRVGLLKLVRDCPWYSPHSLVVEMTDSYMDVTWTEADGTVRTNSKKPKTLKRPVANLKDFPIKRDRIRQFATMAILANGQTFAPLLPPITHDGLEFEVSYLSSTGQRLLTRGADTTARLWDTVTARQIANLRQGDEKVIGIGLSPDGLTALTKSSDGVIRFWETKNGAFRAATEPRPELPEFQLSNDRLLTFPRIPEGDKDSGRPGPAELWDANTGRHIARLEIPNVLRYTVEFFGNGRWINVSNANSSQGHTNANSSQAVFSSSDGRLFAQLNYKNMSDIKAGQTPELSPSGHIATTVADTDRGHFVHAWDTSCWQLISITGPWTGNQMILRNARPISDEMFAASNNFYYVDKTEIYRFGSDKATATFPGVLSKIEGDRALLESGQIFETHTWKRLNPPKGRKYHPDIARFALDGRFIQWKGDEVLDAQTEKTFHLGLGDMGGDGSLDRYDPKTGWIGIVMENLRRLSLRLPPPDHLDIHSDLLKLWAQVAVRGELDEEGVFKKWNEETWEKKRQELASEPAPYADFPFPGYVAQDRLHWLRKEYEAASEAEQPRLARQLLDRAEKAGDASEATRWRAILAPKASLPAGAK
jgi:hypothetical protein